MDLQHEHQYVLASTVYVHEAHRVHSHYFRISTFFCESCLEEKEVTKKEYNKEKAPDWFVLRGCEIRDCSERW